MVAYVQGLLIGSTLESRRTLLFRRSPLTEATRKLRGRFEREVRAVASRTSGSKPIRQSDLEELDATHRLLSYAQGLRQIRTDFIVPIAFFVFLLALLSAALFLHVRQCEVELDFSVTRLGFRLDREQAIFHPLRLERLEVRNADLEIVPDITSHEYALLYPLPSHEGRVTLGTLLLPAGTHVDINGCTSASSCEIRLSGREIELRGSLNGLISHEDSSGARMLSYQSPRNFRIKGGDREFLIKPTLSNEDGWPALTNVHVHGFRLETVSEHPTVGAAFARSISTLTEGRVLFTDLTELSRTLRRRERIEIDFDGWIDELDFSGKSPRLFASGTAREISSVNGENRRNLMPTLLEWWRQRHGLLLLWGSTAYLLTLALSVYHWLKSR
jgi:hypothetical protein